MHHRIINTALLAAVLLLPVSLLLAAENNPDAAGATKPISKSQPAGQSAKDKKPAPSSKAAATAPVKLVDINSASKAELKKLPGIGDAEAAKIIAGRPYLSKANLVTHNIISQDLYLSLRKLIVAKQPPSSTEKPGRKPG
jgi:DNA uptake protein ComE-like DNA-binding protein